MITLELNAQLLADGLALNAPRLFVYPEGGSVSYVPLEPNPLGHKARLIVANVADGQIEIENYTRLSVALWNYADYLPEPGELMEQANELYKAGF